MALAETNDVNVPFWLTLS